MKENWKSIISLVALIVSAPTLFLSVFGMWALIQRFVFEKEPPLHFPLPYNDAFVTFLVPGLLGGLLGSKIGNRILRRMNMIQLMILGIAGVTFSLFTITGNILFE